MLVFNINLHVIEYCNKYTIYARVKEIALFLLTSHRARREAASMRNRGIQLIAIGVNNYDREELLNFTGGDPLMMKVVDNFNDLSQLVNKLIPLSGVCNAKGIRR